MTAGLPGTGIGGLFYLLLVFWMPVRELYLLARGKSSVRRWRSIAFFIALTLSIIVATYAEAWVIGQVVLAIARKIGHPLGQNQAYHLLASTSIIMSLGSLTAVLLAVQALRLIMRWRDSRRATVRTSADLFRDGSMAPGKTLGQLDQSGRAI